MNSTPDGVRILVAGARSASPGIQAFARTLGARLMEFAHPSVVLITGGFGDVDTATVSGALEALAGAGRDRIVTFPQPGQQPVPPFDRTSLVHPRGTTRESRRFEMVAAADAVVAIGGKTGVPQIIALAQALDLPILPLPFTGGGSERFALESDQPGGWRDQFRVGPALRVEWLSSAAKANPAPLADEAAIRLYEGATSTCFVALPFAPETKRLCAQYIVPAIWSAGLRERLSTEDAASGDVTHQILDAIERARVIVGVLDDPRGQQRDLINPNVMYEVGYAHALGKPTVLVTADTTDLPFDLRVHRAIHYGQEAELTHKMRQALDSAREKRGALVTVTPVEDEHAQVADDVTGSR